MQQIALFEIDHLIPLIIVSTIPSSHPQDRDIPIQLGDGQVQLFTRSEVRDMKRTWASREANQRAAEYDVIYDRLQALIVELTDKDKKPKEMKHAVEFVMQNDKVCAPGGITMYKFMEQCRAWRKAQREAAKAAAAAAAAAAAVEQEQVDVED